MINSFLSAGFAFSGSFIPLSLSSMASFIQAVIFLSAGISFSEPILPKCPMAVSDFAFSTSMESFINGAFQKPITACCLNEAMWHSISPL